MTQFSDVPHYGKASLPAALIAAPFFLFAAFTGITNRKPSSELHSGGDDKAFGVSRDIEQWVATQYPVDSCCSAWGDLCLVHVDAREVIAPFADDRMAGFQQAVNKAP